MDFACQKDEVEQYTLPRRSLNRKKEPDKFSKEMTITFFIQDDCLKFARKPNKKDKVLIESSPLNIIHINLIKNIK